MMSKAHQVLRAQLILLDPGERVRYFGWRGPQDKGEGVFLAFIDSIGRQVSPGLWGHHTSDGLLIKRDFSADDGKIFKPFIDERIETDLDTVRHVLEE